MEISGLVKKPLRLDPPDFEAFPGQIADVGQHLLGRRGRGIFLKALLAVAESDEGAGTLKLTSTDGVFSAEVDLEEAGEAILVYGLDGGPLPAREGGPVRFFLHDAEACRGHGDLPCANVKDLGRIEVRR